MDDEKLLFLMGKMLKNQSRKNRDKQKEIYKASKKLEINDSNKEEENK